MLYCNGRLGRSIGDIILMDRVPLLLMAGTGILMMMTMMMVVIMMTVVVMKMMIMSKYE